MRYKLLPPDPYVRHNNLLGGMIETAFNITLLREIDVTPLRLLRTRYRDLGAPRPTYSALVAKAAARALQLHPYSNRVLLKGLLGPRVAQFSQANVAIGVALDAPGREQAAYVADIEDAGRKGLAEITDLLRSFSVDAPVPCEARKRHDSMVERMPTWLLRPFISWSRYFASSWLSWCRSALIISSPGKAGADAIFCSWPWSIGLSFGKIRPRPFEADGELRLCPTMKLTLVVDRRLLAGMAATRFFNAICEGLERPELLEGDDDQGRGARALIDPEREQENESLVWNEPRERKQLPVC